MKKKKSLLSLGILALVLVLGVGYAVVSTVQLSFTGNVQGVADAELKVKIAGTVTSNADKAGFEGTDKASTFTINNMTLNEEFTVTYTIKNEETDIKATLAEAVALNNTNPEYFNATYTINGAEIPAGGTTTVTVTVKMIKTPVLDSQNTAKITFTLDAKPVNNQNS